MSIVFARPRMALYNLMMNQRDAHLLKCLMAGAIFLFLAFSFTREHTLYKKESTGRRVEVWLGGGMFGALSFETMGRLPWKPQEQNQMPPSFLGFTFYFANHPTDPAFAKAWCVMFPTWPVFLVIAWLAWYALRSPARVYR